MVLLALIALSESVLIFIPSYTGVEQDGARFFLPSTSTTQALHDATLLIILMLWRSRWQRVGIFIFSVSAAWRIVKFSGTWISLLLIVKVTIFIPPIQFEQP